MNDRKKTVFLDEEIEPQILAIIREAKKCVVLVTPYLGLWGHAQLAIGGAVKRGIKVTVVTRQNREVNSKLADTLNWLLNNGVEVRVLENLHAKVYMNEQVLMVSSMNLFDFSTNNSLEIALMVSNEHEQQRLRDYVNNRVMGTATSLREAIANANAQQPSGGPVEAAPRPGMGVCIRCGRPLYFEPSKPLCDECYETWREYGNEDYPESFCHRCGTHEETSYARPLCETCFTSQRSW